MTSSSVAMELGPLHCVANENDAAASTGNRALDEHQALVEVDSVNGETAHGDPVTTHPAGHLLALEHAARGGGCTDRARLAVVAVRTVRCGDTGEVVTLHDTGETLALAGADDVDLGARLEDVDCELLAERVLTSIRSAHLGEVAARRDACLVEVTGGRLVRLARVDLAVGDLDRAVAVNLGSAHLGDDVRGDLDDGDRDELVVFIPDLGHAELGAQQTFTGRSCRHGIPYSLISMLTSAGRSRRISESTAFGVGSTMSIRRLWVRFSKCSRLSLYL